jgi:hypothetical protein
MPEVGCASSRRCAASAISAAGDRASRAGRALAAPAGPDGWERCSAESGVHGERLYDWTVLALDPARPPEGWRHWLPVRRQITLSPGQAFHRCAGPAGTPVRTSPDAVPAP